MLNSKWKAALAAAAVSTAALVPLATTAAPAGAWAWSGTVVMSGSAKCGQMPWNPHASWMWVQAGDGEQGWASVNSGNGQWFSQLNRVPVQGTSVTFTWGCPNGARKSTTKWVSRPSWGYGAGFGLFY